MTDKNKIMNRKITILLGGLLMCASMGAQQVDWPEIQTEAKPAARWWWMGSAVDKENLTRNLDAYAKAGMGTMEITPIYGVKGNEANEIPFLSSPWMEMLQYTESEAARLGMQIDMNTGTGWPFGGPEVGIEDAAGKLFITEYEWKGGEPFKEKIVVADSKQLPYAKLSRLMAYSDKGRCIDVTDKVTKDGRLQWKAPKGDWKLIAAFCGKTFQKVKRAAPGGEGYVMDHLSARAVKNYLERRRKRPIRIISSMILMRYIRRIGRRIFLMSSPFVAAINWKNIFRNSCQRNGRIRLPVSSLITGKRWRNCYWRILPGNGRSGRIYMALKPVIRHMDRPVI